MAPRVVASLPRRLNVVIPPPAHVFLAGLTPSVVADGVQRALRILSLFALTGAIACSDGNTPVGGSDAGSDAGVGRDATSDGGSNPGDGSTPYDGGTSTTVCPGAPLTPPATGTCSTIDGDENLVIKGDLITPSGLMQNGQVLVDPNGIILCAACDCSADPAFAGATKLECAQGVISPGLINAHDHITFNEGPRRPPRPSATSTAMTGAKARTATPRSPPRRTKAESSACAGPRSAT